MGLQVVNCMGLGQCHLGRFNPTSRYNARRAEYLLEGDRAGNDQLDERLEWHCGNAQRSSLEQQLGLTAECSKCRWFIITSSTTCLQVLTF